jgi:hypothetical protein
MGFLGVISVCSVAQGEDCENIGYVSQFSIAVTNIWESQFKGRKV